MEDVTVSQLPAAAIQQAAERHLPGMSATTTKRISWRIWVRVAATIRRVANFTKAITLATQARRPSSLFSESYRGVADAQKLCRELWGTPPLRRLRGKRHKRFTRFA